MLDNSFYNKNNFETEIKVKLWFIISFSMLLLLYKMSLNTPFIVHIKSCWSQHKKPCQKEKINNNKSWIINSFESLVWRDCQRQNIHSITEIHFQRKREIQKKENSKFIHQCFVSHIPLLKEQIYDSTSMMTGIWCMLMILPTFFEHACIRHTMHIPWKLHPNLVIQ